MKLKLCLLFLFLAFSAQAQDVERFRLPTPDSQVATWWHWMDGSFTKEGITKDLEAMKAQGSLLRPR